MEVGVRELKQRLSHYLDQVASGHEVVVTERGRPKARIVAITDGGALERGIEEGWIRPPQRDGPVGSWPRHRAARPSSDVLGEDRG